MEQRSTVTPAAFNTPETEPGTAGFHPIPSALTVFVRLHQAGQHSATTHTCTRKDTYTSKVMRETHAHTAHVREKETCGKNNSHEANIQYTL